MILVDANLLIYATTECPEYDAASRWLDGAINANQRVGMPWISLLAFVRIVTNHRVYSKPMPASEACEQIDAWLSRPNVWIPSPTARHAEYFRQALANARGGANLVSDAHLVALAMEHGLTIYSADTDFQKFLGLNWLNPLMPA